MRLFLKGKLRLSIFFINLFYNSIMSLYEQFHSDINKEYMYNLIKTIIHDKLDIDISLEPANYQTFCSSIPMIFNTNSADEIEEMNKFLLNHNVEYFLEKLNEAKTEEHLEPIIKDDFERLLQEREKQDILSETSKTSSSDNISMDIQEVNSNDSIGMLLDNFKVKEVKEVKEQVILTKQTEKESRRKPIHMNSSKRTNINSSRYNYRLDLEKQGIVSSDIKTISKVMIPIEDNYLFSIPVLVVSIPELNCTIHMQQEELIEGNNRKYGIYQPLEYHSLNVDHVKRITVDIRDVSEKKYLSNDILKVNIIEFRNNRIYFTCSSIHKLDFQNGDYIKVINNNSHNQLFHIFQEPLKIKKIQDNILVCEYRGFDEIEERTFTNIDMKIMNMSNQNIIYFN
jgi:hypothetical protein